MTFSEFERVLNHCPHFTNFWLFLRVGEFCLFVLLTSMNHFVLTSEAQLRYVVKEFLEYYNHERPHSALDGRMIKPRPQDADGEIVEFSRLGGLLKSYRRVKIAS